MCDDYAQIDSRIQVIHQPNRGLSGARNSGLCESKGKYIIFIDSDDIIASNMIEVLYDAITKNECQVSCCKYRAFVDDEMMALRNTGVGDYSTHIKNNISVINNIYYKEDNKYVEKDNSSYKDIINEFMKVNYYWANDYKE